MGLNIKAEGMDLINKGLEPFIENPLNKKEVKEVSRLLIDVLSDNSRWVKLDNQQVDKYTNGQHPKGNFEETSFSSIQGGKEVQTKVKCEAGVYSAEIISERGVIRGWHKYLLGKIKAANIKLPNTLAEKLFELGQTLINDKNKVYRR